MPYAMVLTTKIRQGVSRTSKQRIRQAVFGDGYSQEVPDGINAQMDVRQNVGWDSLTAAEVGTARAMLDAVGSTDYISWTPPGESVEKRWKVTNEGYTETYTGTLTNITFNLREVP
ncbi:phage tail protein [Leptothrix discophora]|uniref:Phage tail protein n=1 Tax=Leptothrix discophora TaxID=89 RepID=A0ABT9G0C5_LEPDI|nr:phage tail protein [Leptothrix discophora]MDP4299932.1 phage tail protein [Leptothrix discophora]